MTICESLTTLRRCFVGIVLATAIPSIHAQTLEWEVVNRFPLLGEQSFAEISVAWLKTSRELGRPASMHDFILTRMTAKSADPTKRSFLLVDPARLSPNPAETVRIRGPVEVKLTGPQASKCTWSVRPQPSGQRIDREACIAHFHVDREVPYEVTVTVATGQTAATRVLVRDILILAMGDSYSAGEGAPDRPAIYSARFDAKRLKSNSWFLEDSGEAPIPAVWWDQICHRSLLSWQIQAALRLALNHPHTVVRVLHTSCSGAEFFDGMFNAQMKSDASGNSLESATHIGQLTTSRDGDGRRALPEPSGLYLHASQINAVRRVLCPWDPVSDDLLVPGFEFKAKWMRCPEPLPHMRPDALLLTIGGNDVRFSGAVGGILVPETGRSFLGGLALTIGRKAAGLMSPAELTRNIQGLRPYYAALVDALAKAALTSTENTILLEYPNPIGTYTQSLASDCYSTAVQARIKDAHLAFSVAAKEMIPFGRLANWSAELTPTEVNEFSQHGFEELTRMIRSSNAATTIPWNQSADGERGFTHRLLCTDYPDSSKMRSAQLQREPVYFCQITEGEHRDSCTAKPLAEWSSELPGRRIINSSNDAILAQRTYDRAPPSRGALMKAMSGTFHPTAEAYAVAADSAYAGLCKVLAPRGLCQPEATR